MNSGKTIFSQLMDFLFRRLYSHTIDKSTGIQCDQTIVPQNFYAQKNYIWESKAVPWFHLFHPGISSFLMLTSQHMYIRLV